VSSWELHLWMSSITQNSTESWRPSAWRANMMHSFQERKWGKELHRKQQVTSRGPVPHFNFWAWLSWLSSFFCVGSAPADVLCWFLVLSKLYQLCDASVSSPLKWGW
jgi:hypothetical protein